MAITSFTQAQLAAGLVVFVNHGTLSPTASFSVSATDGSLTTAPVTVNVAVTNDFVILMHLLPKGLHRIGHYGLFANANRAENIATARALLNVTPPVADSQEPPDIATDTPRVLPCPCPRCGACMIVIETLAPGCEPRWRPTPSMIDTS